MKECIFCKQPFEIITKGSGGQNRTICYNCMPAGLNKEEREHTRRYLCSINAQRQKLELGCSICGYNKCAKALEWHHEEGDTKLNNPSDFSKVGNWNKYQI